MNLKFSPKKKNHNIGMTISELIKYLNRCTVDDLQFIRYYSHSPIDLRKVYRLGNLIYSQPHGRYDDDEIYITDDEIIVDDNDFLRYDNLSNYVGIFKFVKILSIFKYLIDEYNSKINNSTKTFKIGDKVMIKEWNEMLFKHGSCGGKYGYEIISCELGFSIDMRKYCGKVMTIDYINGINNDIYIMKGCSDQIFSTDMFDLIE